MAKAKSTRIFELAKEVGTTSKAVLEVLKAAGIPAKGALSVMTQQQVNAVLEHFTKAEGQAAKASAPQPPAPAAKPEAKPAAAEAPKPKAPEKPEAPEPPPVKPEPQAPPPPPPPPPPAAPQIRTYTFGGPVTVTELAPLIGTKSSEIIKTMLQEKILITLNQRVGLEVVRKICEKFGVEVREKEAPAAAAAGPKAVVDSAKLKPRAPVVTIMGHVDHGKTSLLDAIRKTDVAGGEAGGITQHIGAHKVTLPNHGEVVFLDTPGHEAFTTLRARGAKVTDVVVLVVAADDGVKPQTVEAIDHAKAAAVPIVVAINKMDKPEANPQRVKQELSALGLAPEDWGGKTIMVEVSARKKTGLDQLLEMLLLEAELLELKADPSGPGVGTVIEARMDRSKGPVATILVQSGTLRTGDIVWCGNACGRIRRMTDDHGKSLDSAGPSTPVQLLGLSEVPESGTTISIFTDEREARDRAQAFSQQRQTNRLRQRHISLHDLSESVKTGETKELRLIIKTDVQGSMEALLSTVARLSNEQVKLSVIHEGVGRINESDAALAAASDAVVIGFNVDMDDNASAMAKLEGVEVRTYRVIFEAIDELKKAMEGMLSPRIEEISIGKAEVRQTFRTPRGAVAGCFVLSGKASRGEKAKVFRGGKLVHEGNLSSLRRFKEDVREVASGYECGAQMAGFNDFQPGDLIEFFTEQATQEKLRI